MSFLSDFEDRIGSVFGDAPQGYAEPFSFKKLAKRAAREMEHETYEIDGVDTAPALYTVLVSSSDDSLMRPLYARICKETSDFVKFAADRKGYLFVGEPLVRFMVDPSLRSGKFAVFAENIDAQTLSRLREEERAFLGGNSRVGGAAAVTPLGVQAHAKRRGNAAMPAATPLVTPQPVRSALDDSSAGLNVMPSEFGDPTPLASASESTPMPIIPLAGAAAATPLVTMGAHSAAPQAAPQQAPATQRRNVPLVNANARASHAASCLLVDRQSGRTYNASEPSAIIGRERAAAQIVLHDPNVSRRHAELSYDGSNWHIVDLNSTNGTLVNDVDVDECVLRDGDLVTIGLVNLEFREN